MVPSPPALLSFDRLTAGGVAWAVAIIVLLFVGSIALVAVLLVRLPATYFQDYHPREDWRARHPVLRWAIRIVKNLVGALLVAAGAVMLVAPGQGVLTILLGATLLDFPGKRRFERRLIGRPPVLRAVNRLRARFGKPPVVLE